MRYNLDYVKYDTVEEQLEEQQDEQQYVPNLPTITPDDYDAEKPVEDGNVLDILPLKNMVLFPGVMAPVILSRAKTKKLATNALKKDFQIVVVTQKDSAEQEPTANDLYAIGVTARVLHIAEYDRHLVAILEGLQRVNIDEIIEGKSGMKARVSQSPEVFPKRSDKEFDTLAASMKEQAELLLNSMDKKPAQAAMTLQSLNNPPTLVNYLCVNFISRVEDKQMLLEMTNLKERAIKLSDMLSKEITRLRLLAEIQEKTKENVDKDQREYFLHQQLEAIQKELGDSNDDYIKDIKQRAEKKHWPERVKKVFDDELAKLQRMSQRSADYSTVQTYLETLIALPWDEYTQDQFDLKRSQEILDRDHYGIDKVKERIIEYLAVLKQKGDMKSPILCLYGPPGVGKTSLGKSVAESLGRKYARISLGGLHDESEIRGHRRTYVGAMPGRIVDALRKVGASNPVFVLDEIDKVGADYKGDPTSALLEVLDPEQNSAFHDNYLDVEYDLSKVLFIATANTLDSIPLPLLDRMELIEMTGYSIDEKIEIAKRHLLPKVFTEHGLKDGDVNFPDDTIKFLIEGYTRESGVRSLDRQIASVCRKVVKHIALEEDYNKTLTDKDIIDYLGQPRYSKDTWETNKYIGVVTGLAWTQVGGEILFIETSLSPSKSPTLTITGNLGDVMKESATIALGYIKAHAKDFGIPQKTIDSNSVHIHVPEGAIPKDGPSAGITMTTALVSVFTGRKVRERIAMTGEMTLRGKVLPIGGVKEKLLAAKRAGITDLILCEDNRKDVNEIPAHYLEGLTFHFVRDISEVIDFALLKD